MSGDSEGHAVFQRGDFTLASGAKSRWKIECDALTEADWTGLAAMLVEHLPERFVEVLGVPRGGVPLANALAEHRDPSSDRLLVVDDVWTTGGSMRRFISTLGYEFPVDRAVIFGRGPVPLAVTALFQMPPHTQRGRAV